MEQHQAYGHSGPAYAFQPEDLNRNSTTNEAQPQQNQQNQINGSNQLAHPHVPYHSQQQNLNLHQFQQQQNQMHQQLQFPPASSRLTPIHYPSAPGPGPAFINRPPPPPPSFNLQPQQQMMNYNPGMQMPVQMQPQLLQPTGAALPRSNSSLPPSVHHSPQPSSGAAVRLQNFVFPPNVINPQRTGSVGGESSNSGMGMGIGGNQPTVSMQYQTGMNPNGMNKGNWNQRNQTQASSSRYAGGGGGETSSATSSSNHATQSIQPVYSYPVSKNGTPLLSTASRSNSNYKSRNGPQIQAASTPSGCGNGTVTSSSATSSVHPILARLPSLPDLPQKPKVAKGLDLENLKNEPSSSSSTVNNSSSSNNQVETHPDSGSSLSSSESLSISQADLLIFVKDLCSQIKTLEERDQLRSLREEALAFSPELAYEEISKGKGKEKGQVTIPKEFQPVLGIRLLQRIDKLQRENEELGEILEKKLGLNVNDEKRKLGDKSLETEEGVDKVDEKVEDEKEVLKRELEDAHSLLSTLSASLTAATSRAKAAENALVVACAQISSQPVFEIGNGNPSKPPAINLPSSNFVSSPALKTTTNGLNGGSKPTSPVNPKAPWGNLNVGKGKVNGPKDKDKDKEKEREKEKDSRPTSPVKSTSVNNNARNLNSNPNKSKQGSGGEVNGRT